MRSTRIPTTIWPEFPVLKTKSFPAVRVRRVRRAAGLSGFRTFTQCIYERVVANDSRSPQVAALVTFLAIGALLQTVSANPLLFSEGGVRWERNGILFRLSKRSLIFVGFNFAIFCNLSSRFTFKRDA